MKREAYKSLRTISHEDPLGPGGPLCAGCGGQLGLRLFHKALGENVIFVNAASCSTLLATYPFTPLNSSWLYTAMACAPAGAQGVRDALDVLIAKKRLPPEENLDVVVLSGDGAAYGMGLSATSAAIDRGLDFLYICYDNEGYGNTGQQASAATPFGAATASSTGPGGYPGSKKDLFAIWAANRPAYVATAIGAEPLDLARKIEKAKSLRGPRLVIVLAPCPTGWDFDPSEMAEIGRLAVATGIWPLKEWEAGRVVHTKMRRPRLPVALYLERQGRFRHLFEPRRDEARLAEIQAQVDAYWKGIA
jgi:pyruvate ferredoxin oxidoreductase beta subunit